MKKSLLKKGLALLLFGVVTVAAIAPGIPDSVHAEEQTVKITANVDGWDGVFLEDTIPAGEAYALDPKVGCFDEDGKLLLGDMIDAHREQNETLIWYDEKGDVFDWMNTVINHDITITGHWEPCKYEIVISYDDEGKTEDIKTEVNPGETFQDVYGSLENPERKGYEFLQWEDMSTGEEFDPNAEITENKTVIARWKALTEHEEFEPYNPVNDIPQNISGNCYIGKSWMVGSQSYFNLSGFEGVLAGQSVVGWCSDHGAAEPHYTTASYTGSLQSVDVNSGEVIYKVTVYPPGAATDASMLRPRGKGYQRVAATVKMKRDFGGMIQINKSSANPSITDGNQCYSLEDAEFEVINSKGNVVDTLITDTEGNTKSSKALPAGKYTVHEKKAPKGYQTCSDVTVTVNVGETKKVSIKDEPTNDPSAIELVKVDKETGTSNTQGASSLEGAQFTVKYYDGYYTEDTLPEEATRTWILQTKKIVTESGNIAYRTGLREDFLVEGSDELYKQGNIAVLPVGTITVEETKAPEGYLLDNAYLQAEGSEEKIEGIYLSQITQNGDAAFLTGGNEYSMSDQVARGDLKLTKVEDKTMKRMSEIPFKITSKTTGENHVIVTDKNGIASTSASWNMHSENTNAGTGPKDGIWFNGLNDEENGAPVNDELGALPYDTYIIEELECENNKGKKLLPPFEVEISRNMYEVDLGTVTNDGKTRVLISKTDATTGEQIEGATLELYKKNNGEWEKIDSTITTKEVWNFAADEGEYKLVEIYAPAEYLLAEAVEFTVHDGEVVKEVEMKDEPIKISGNIDKKQTVAGDNSQYSYTIDYASTSNTFADELNVTDPLESVNAGYTRLDSLKTPVSFDDYDGKMNIWYQTNKNDKTDSSDADKYNACSTNPDNTGNPDKERILDYTGWKLWKADVSTLEAETLTVSDLKLAEGEYVTAVRFEHGRVEKGFTTRKADNKEGVLDEEKSVHDNLEKVTAPYETAFNMKNAANESLTADKEIHYSPIALSMTIVQPDEYKKGTIELWNSAQMDIYRNKGITENLKDSDEDKVVQKYQKAADKEKFSAPKTGIRNYGIVFLAGGILLMITAICLFRKARKNKVIKL